MSTTTENGNALPAYQRIQAAIRERIDAGELKPGDAVDSERELAKLHRVSLMTARHALAELQHEGLVERRRGSGTFVAPPKIEFNKLTSFTEQMALRSLPVHSKVLHAGIVESGPEIVARLSLPPMASLVFIERLRIGANEPFALESCYLSAAEYAGLTRVALNMTSLFEVLQRDFNTDLAYADEEIDATVADPKTADLLDIPRGAPLLRIRQTIFSTQGKAVLYVLGLYRSDRHTLRIRRFR